MTKYTTSNDNILIVGDGDFTFSLAIAKNRIKKKGNGHLMY